MPKPPLPAALIEVLKKPNPSVIATLKPDGAPTTVATWYLWDDGRILLSMDQARQRLTFLRNDPRVSLTVLDVDGWDRHVSLRGRVVSLEDDVEWKSIDRLSRQYTGEPYFDRVRPRVTGWMEIDSWHGWADSASVPRESA
jgi:PPOX class probable F420-dependent enzyme